MPLEDQIASLVAAIDRNTAAILGQAPAAAPEPVATKPKKEKATPAPVPTAEVEIVLPTEEQMMEAGQRILTAGKKPLIAGLNKKYGIERGRELLKDPAKKDQLVAYFTELKAIADAA